MKFLFDWDDSGSHLGIKYQFCGLEGVRDVIKEEVCGSNSQMEKILVFKNKNSKSSKQIYFCFFFGNRPITRFFSS